MIIISKRVYPITIFCGNLFELRAPLHWKIVANTSCDRPKVAKNRAVSEAQGPLLFVVCHSFIVCCHGFLPRFVSSRPGSRVFFSQQKKTVEVRVLKGVFFLHFHLGNFEQLMVHHPLPPPNWCLALFLLPQQP